ASETDRHADHADEVVAGADELAADVLAGLRNGQHEVVGDDRILDVDLIGPPGPQDAAPVGRAEVLDDGGVEDGPAHGKDAASAPNGGGGAVAADGAIGQVHRGGADAAPGAGGRVAADGAAGGGQGRRADAAASPGRGGVAADGAVGQVQRGGVDAAPDAAGGGVAADGAAEHERRRREDAAAAEEARLVAADLAAGQ